MRASLPPKFFSTPEHTFKRLTLLVKAFLKSSSIEEKIQLLDQEESLLHFFSEPQELHSLLKNLPPESELIIKSIIAIDQADRLFYQPSLEGLQALLHQLLPVEKFYSEIGGIVGYQWLMLQLLFDWQPVDPTPEHYLRPEGVDMSQEDQVREAIIQGIYALPHMAEIYPVGGAADRLEWLDPSGEPLPAACLPFLGRTLLEGLIRDLQAREYLYFQLFGELLTTPVAMMTSQEKNNEAHMMAICREKRWFGRPKKSFRFFSQPSVPTLNREGNWCLQAPMKLLLKPGGHGVIWKLARDEGIFSWFSEENRSKALVRQINNPIAGVDYGLAAFTGWGWMHDKQFGFASCPRLLQAQEGINVLIEKKVDNAFTYVLTNIEYSELKRCNILDQPLEEGSLFSKFSSNTNLLFIDLKAIEEAVNRSPIPGKIVNFKKSTFHTETGEVKEEIVARLESMMQNIADLFIEKFPHPLKPEEQDRLSTFITYHERRKTISTAKRTRQLGGSLIETPEGCFLDYMINIYELLSHCGMELPSWNKEPGVIDPIFPFTSAIHPALGPFYSIIAQKIEGGSLSLGSDLHLEISDLHLVHLRLEGALSIESLHPMGHIEEGSLRYSHRTGRCVLKNVHIKNRGLDHTKSQPYWKRSLVYNECCSIKLEGLSEFYAEDLLIEGNFALTIKEGYRVTAYQDRGCICLLQEKIDNPTWSWLYSIDENQKIILKKSS